MPCIALGLMIAFAGLESFSEGTRWCHRGTKLAPAPGGGGRAAELNQIPAEWGGAGRFGGAKRVLCYVGVGRGHLGVSVYLQPLGLCLAVSKCH